MKMKVLAAVAGLAAVGCLADGVKCADGVCTLGGGTGEADVLQLPVSAVKPVAQAPRLKSLDGKTFAVVGGSFMASVTHPEIKRLILSEFPKSKVYLLGEIGSAGPYPREGVVRTAAKEFERKLKEYGIDAVISGNGGCGLCTPKEAGSCIAAERGGLPSVFIAAPAFVAQAKSAALAAGVEVLRVAEYPGAFAAHSREELLKNTREKLWPAIKDALTRELSADERTKAETAMRSDGLPTVRPTAELVAEFLKFTDKDGARKLGAIPPGQMEVTVRHVATVGAMAGCSPEHMPVLLALTEAMKDGDFRRPLASTHGWTAYCWVNGPVARQLGIDCGQGEVNSAANMAIGRFLNLALINLAGSRVKENRMGTFGYMMPWCMAEDEEAAVKIGWKPYHLQQGYGLDDSVVTAASAINWGNNLVPATSDPEKIKDMIAWDAVEKQQMAVGSGMPFTCRTFLLTPEIARNLAKAYPGKADLEQAVAETARSPLAMRAYANYWGNPGSSVDGGQRQTLERHKARIGQQERAERTAPPPWLEWTGAESMETVPVMEIGKSAFLVTGDASRNKEMCLPGGGRSSVKIELPAKWDELMEERGYEPLSKFKLESNLKPDPKPAKKYEKRRPLSVQGARREGSARANGDRGGKERPQRMRRQRQQEQ